MPPRKRFSAFDDFSSAPPAASNEKSPLPPVGERVPAAAPVEPQVERIERLPPSQMMPDRFQPRRLLPISIRNRFFSGEIDCYRAAGEWLAMARSDPAMRAEIDRLMAMGISFDQYGQIKPITGSWVSRPDGSYIYQIETGERRFWAACLQYVEKGLTEEPLLRVEVVPNPNRQRQVVENRHAEPPSAVEQACEVAALILAEMNVEPDPDLRDEYDYFRQARNQRMPAGLWDRVIPVMQLTRPRMVQLLNILQLPSPLLDLADRYRLPERVLREVLALPREHWERMLRASIQQQLTSDDVADLAAHEPLPEDRRRSPSMPADPTRKALRALRRFARTLGELDPVSRAQALDEMADSLVVGGDVEEMMNLLDELAVLVEARLRRRSVSGKR